MLRTVVVGMMLALAGCGGRANEACTLEMKIVMPGDTCSYVISCNGERYYTWRVDERANPVQISCTRYDGPPGDQDGQNIDYRWNMDRGDFTFSCLNHTELHRMINNKFECMWNDLTLTPRTDP